MKKLLGLALIPLFTLPAYTQPKIDFNTRSIIDFGKVSLDSSPLQKEVSIYNRGDDTLNVFHINTSCGCTTAPLDKDHIPPGDSAKMDIKLKLYKTGAFEKTISIWSNDPKNKAKVIVLKGEAFQPILLDPPKLIILDDSKVGDVRQAEFKLINTTDESIMIKDFTVYPEHMKTDLMKGTEIPARGELIVNMVVEMKKEGNFNGQIKIITDCKEQEEVVVNSYSMVSK